MNRQEAFRFLTETVAISYRPRRMPWEHDQDSIETQKQVLAQWVDLLAGYPTEVVTDAFDTLTRHQTAIVPTLNEARAQLRRLADLRQEPLRRAATRTVPPQTGFIIAYEAYCEEVTRLGRTPDETAFTKKFHRMFNL